MKGLAETIFETGWTPVEFDMDASDRDEFTRLGREVILLAVDEPLVKSALSFELDPSLITGSNNPTFYGIDKARNSDDVKLWLHSGYQTAERFRAAAPRFAHVDVIKKYFVALDDVLGLLENSFVPTLESLSTNPEDIQETFFPDDIEKRVMHVRTVRYLGLDQAEVGTEVITSHADMSLASIQFYETHAGYLKGAAMADEMVRWDAEPDRIGYAAALIDEMEPIDYDYDTEAAFFFGSGLKGFSRHDITGASGARYPVLFHAGFRPETSRPNFGWDELSATERVTTVAFLHPRIEILRDAQKYRLPSVEMCRPLR